MSPLLGLWLFTGLIYHGEPQPPPNPDLVMTFDFFSPTENRLRYYRKNEHGFCERTARFTFDGQYLAQEVISTHPDNASFCDADPDMRVGNKSVNRLEALPPQFLLHLDLGEEELILVWNHQTL